MKAKLKLLSLPLSMLYLFVSIVGCSPSDVATENQQLSEQAREDAEKAVSLYDNLTNLKNKTSYSKVGLTQELVDDYLVSAGFQPGELTVETVNQIISGLSESKELSFEDQIALTTYSPYVKEKLIEIKTTGFIENLQKEADFEALSFNERKVLLTSNALVDEFNKAARNGTVDVPCPSDGCTATMVLLGASIGSAICGPLCGVFGGVIGLMIGTSLKD